MFNSGEYTPHQPVLYQEIISALQPRNQGKYVDCTLGAGGHAWGILTTSSPDGMLLGLDLDPAALHLAQERLSIFGKRAILMQASYITLLQRMAEIGWNQVDGIVLDLGVSSMQLDQAERGFSFQEEGPLDMRFDPSQPVSAADLVNHCSETDLANIIWQYGEEPRSRQIARAICQARPLHTTAELADVIVKTIGKRKGGAHPATQTFQALRIAVNQELTSVREVLPQAIQALSAGGRLAVIAFHSLEDRIVKQYFRQESTDCICPPGLPACICGHKASLVEKPRHAIFPSEAEILINPRARSARLRVVEKL
ncbi:MAG TPA: 16S rRNA (cytosine(1402)-N(4))-methyltransferase RsmH [Anaerolineaceae bacterium]